jgi:hypothetical protein
VALVGGAKINPLQKAVDRIFVKINADRRHSGDIQNSLRQSTNFEEDRSGWYSFSQPKAGDIFPT